MLIKNKTRIKVLLSLLLGVTSASAFAAGPCCPAPCCPSPVNFYVGGFGGWGASSGFDISQSGTVFFTPTLDVHATGDTKSKSAWLAGAHIGVEGAGWLLSNGSWTLVPGAELEGYYLRNNVESDPMLNPTPRIPGHSFVDTFDMNTGVFLANAVFSLKSPCSRISPYIAGGIGGATVSLSNADSEQVVPPEADVNHFNSRTSDREWTFAAQAKAGLRFCLSNHLRAFAEYRFTHLSPTNYTFGSTQYPTHAATTNWNTRFSGMNYNMGVVGLEWLI